MELLKRNNTTCGSVLLDNGSPNKWQFSSDSLIRIIPDVVKTHVPSKISRHAKSTVVIKKINDLVGVLMYTESRGNQIY